MKNFVQVGNVLDVPAPNAVTSGPAALIGTIVGVAAADYANGAQGQFNVTGIYDFPKAPSQAWTVGAKVYWDNTAKVMTTTVGTNTLAGIAVLAVGGTAGETTGRVRLNGTAA